MVRIKIQRETHKRGSANNGEFLFPVGKINQMTVYPMTFDEFLMNSNRILYNVIKKAYESKTPLDTKIHELAMDQVYKYLLVGGMSEAILRSRTLFQNIYKELNKESKNFSPGLIEEKSKTRDYTTSIQWLTMAHIINQSF